MGMVDPSAVKFEAAAVTTEAIRGKVLVEWQGAHSYARLYRRKYRPGGLPCTVIEEPARFARKASNSAHTAGR
jgi:hypothetical protein